MAEWQTRTVQVRVSVRTWGFNSPLAHLVRWPSGPPSLFLGVSSSVLGGDPPDPHDVFSARPGVLPLGIGWVFPFSGLDLALGLLLILVV